MFTTVFKREYSLIFDFSITVEAKFIIVNRYVNPNYTMTLCT